MNYIHRYFRHQSTTVAAGFFSHTSTSLVVILQLLTTSAAQLIPQYDESVKSSRSQDRHSATLSAEPPDSPPVPLSLLLTAHTKVSGRFKKCRVACLHEPFPHTELHKIRPCPITGIAHQLSHLSSRMRILTVSPYCRQSADTSQVISHNT